MPYGLIYILQMAVSLRIKNHVPPLIYPEGRQVMEATKMMAEHVEPGQKKSFLVDELFRKWEDYTCSLQTEGVFGRFIRELKKVVEGTAADGTSLEQCFFIVEKTDIKNIRIALDNLHKAGVWPRSVDGYYIHYLQSSSELWHESPPLYKTTLMRFERLAMLHRRRMRAMSLPNVATYTNGYMICLWDSSKCGRRLQFVMTEYDDSWSAPESQNDDQAGTSKPLKSEGST
ncbi:hypothetical protein F4804DRAFT_353412 [Jackrogersella minutella]|nr:hypothetical protein F4804DRAFT_353412 [Jackrogersella minutella]